MQHFTTPGWGYKLSTENSIEVYHYLLPKISLKTLCNTITHVQEICQRVDGSITIVTDSKEHSWQALEELSYLFKKVETNYLDTPELSYKIPDSLKPLLREWSLAFLGCVALLLTSDKGLEGKFSWQYINSRVGGLYLDPFTLFFYGNYAKVIHPVTSQNYDTREKIEQKTAHFVNAIVKRISESQPGFEGLALLSLVEEKTLQTPKEIVKIINDKSYNVKVPVFSALFS